jgi:hypothetical protein
MHLEASRGPSAILKTRMFRAPAECLMSYSHAAASQVYRTITNRHCPKGALGCVR